jgi:ABC-type phosphate transport system substrate-binding protein
VRPASSRALAALAASLALLPAVPPARGQGGTPAATAPRFTSETLPRLDGSTSAEPLLALLACRSLGLACDWHPLDGVELPRSPRPRGPVAAWPPVFPLAQGGTTPKLMTRGTHGAYLALVAGQADLIAVARAPSAEELRTAAAAGVTLRVTPVAWDALVFVVNRGNAVETLTLDQVRDIYAGRALRWSDVAGGRSDPVRPLLRDPQSGSAELFAKHVTPSPAGQVVGDRLIMTMMGLIDAVGSRPNDLGYTVYYYAKTFLEAAGPPRGLGAPFKLIAIDGVAPTDETIAAGTYRLREPVYAVIRQDAPPPVAALHDWLSSADGQRLVAESGYLPVRGAAGTR